MGIYTRNVLFFYIEELFAQPVMPVLSLCKIILLRSSTLAEVLGSINLCSVMDPSPSQCVKWLLCSFRARTCKLEKTGMN